MQTNAFPQYMQYPVTYQQPIFQLGWKLVVEYLPGMV